jgi:AraC-like DNA-binding protein/cell division protein FtsB
MEEVNQTSENMIYQSNHTADILLTSTFYNFYQIFSNNKDADITNALYSEKLDLYDVDITLSKLKQQLMSNPLLYSIYIYNATSGKILFHTKEYTGFEPAGRFYDKNIVDLLSNPDSYAINTYFTRKVRYELDQKEFNDNYITMIFAYTSKGKGTEGAMVINLDQVVFQQMVTNGRLGDLNQVFIINRDGSVISHSDTAMINRNLGNEPYIKEILASREKSGHFTSVIKKKNSLVTYMAADHFQWIFVGVGEYSKLLSAVASMQRTIVVLTIAFILVGLIVAAVFASSIYNPFHRLLQDIQKRIAGPGKQKSLDVYDYLKYTFNELADDIEELKLNVDHLSVKRKKELLHKIVSGEIIYTPGLKRELEECGALFDLPYFLLLVLKIDHFQEVVLRDWENDADLLKFAVLNMACELVGQDYTVEGIDNGADHISLVLNLQNSDAGHVDSLAFLIGELQASVRKYLKCTVTAGIGAAVKGMENINHSFKTALAAADYRVVFGRNSVIAYSQLEGRNSGTYEYPYSSEKSIIDAIKQSNTKRLNSGLEEFFSTIGRFSHDEIMVTVTQLLMILSKTVNGLIRDNMEFDAFHFKTLSTGVFSMETLEEMKAHLNELCQKAVDFINSSPYKNKRIKVINSVREYVGEHYQDPNLAVENIADYLQLSCNYVRTLFKEITDNSISDYITRFRLSKAQEMLADTDLTVKRIAELSGYSDKKYFYVLFKKHCGKTPEDFRNDVRNGKGGRSMDL